MYKLQRTKKELIMKRKAVYGSIIVVAFAIIALGILPQFVISQEKKMDMPFGGKMDVEFAEKAWKAMEGYDKWLIQSEMVPGKSPHGKFIKLYYSMINVDEKPYHVIIKDNFMPDKKLAAVTVMIQREDGYDADNNNWFWVKYNPDGSIDKNDKDMAMAGRVAKGMDMGCIACHKASPGNDYLFLNDSGGYGIK